MGEKLLDISVDKDFFGIDPKDIGNKSKNKEMGLHQTKRFLQSTEDSLFLKEWVFHSKNIVGIKTETYETKQTWVWIWLWHLLHEGQYGRSSVLDAWNLHWLIFE